MDDQATCAPDPAKALSPERLRQVLVEWNDTARPIGEESLPELFERQVARDPDHTCVISGSVHLTYGELNAWANRLAHWLIARGAGPETVICVLVPRSVELIVAMLAVVKTGAAYLPVDPSYPAERVEFMMTDVESVVLLDQRAMVVNTGNGYPETNPADTDRRSPLTQAHPAYVMYTSGSTGRPKGVVVPHRGVVDYLAFLRDRVGLGPQDTVLNLASASFDPSVRDIFGPLTSGAVLVVVPDHQAKDPHALLAELVRHEVTVLPALVPAMLAALADAAEATGTAPLKSLRAGLISGEALTAAHVRRAGSLGAHWELINQYGPTECTMIATTHSATTSSEDPRVPIGRPIPNSRCYVLDDTLRPVPPGVTGELYLGGDCLARGYINRPALTAERFLADPSGEAGSRMYRTGDLAEWRTDGVLEFRGRADDQVKLRGMRVEPGEIEAVLASCPSLARAAVDVRADRLIGYLVGDAEMEPAAVKAWLAARLPDYMVPSAFVVLDKLPLSPNGKVDRAALPDPDFAGAGRRAKPAREKVLCELFAEVLDVPEVGATDDFFELGGHSLLAFRLVNRIRSVLGVELELRTVFEARSAATLLTRLGPASRARPALVPANRPALMPLSVAQRRLWFMHRFEGPNPAYNIVWTARLTGDLDRAALASAIDDVIERHESLRTVFAERDGDPYQVVLAAERTRGTMSIVDVTAGGVAAAVDGAARETFDLAVDIPFRARLFAVGEKDHTLVLVTHHIAADGGSVVPLARDLSAAYQARCTGSAPDWTPLAVQYADFALWQSNLPVGDDEHLEYWRRTLAGAPELLELPTDRPRPSEASHKSERILFAGDADLHQRVLNLAQATGTTVFMVVHAALAALLTRMGSGTDLPLGTVTAGRDDDAVDDAVGFFVNTLVLRTDTSGDPSFGDLLNRVREVDLAAYANQDVSFERLVEVLSPVRSLSHTPLFQVILTYDNGAEARLDLPGLCAQTTFAGSGAAKFDLSFFVWEARTADGEPAGIEGYLDYATDLFDHSTAEGLTARLMRLLAGGAADPRLPISRIEVLSAQEREELLVACNDTDVPVPAAVLPDLFAAQVRRVPGATAVVFEDDRLTYAELDARASRLARLLVQSGVGPESFVGVGLPKSVDLIVALLAVLKAGAAYLAVDLGYPAERIAFMFEDVDPVLVLTRSDVADRLPVSGNVLVLDDPYTAEVIGTLSGRDLTDDDRTHPLRPHNAAFAIYTSGSTGRPKGVVVEHHSLNHYLAWARHVYPGVRGRALVHSSVSFDLTVTGIYAPLTAGGCVHLIDLDEHAGTTRNPVRPTFVKATPSHLPLLIELPPRFSPTEQLVLGGEPLLGEVLDEWRAKHPGVTVFNEYGPTETTVECMDCHILPGEQVPPGVVTLGVPSWNTQMYVLDVALSPVPAGVPGEIYIAGDLVTRGYHNRPSLTAGRYVANPFGPPGSRMYRSGDLAKRGPDGRLEFIARVDDQVKIRGYRIELGEIDAVLNQEPGVAHAAVIVREDRPGDKRLVAYFVPADGQSPDEQALRDWCGEYMPDYMVPSAFVPMQVLPLTPNRKLDRKSLPAPVYQTETNGAEPCSPREEILCGLFAEALGVPKVGVHDDFFVLGGHSLLAVRLISRIRSAFGVELPLRVLFEVSTVAGVAGQLAAAGEARPALRRMPRPEEAK